MNTWKRITEYKPVPNQQVLVYDRGSMYVSSADFYDEQTLAMYREMGMNQPRFLSDKDWRSQRDHYLNCLGCFSEFVQKSYFDDPKVFWMELPEEPKDV